jgi:predicted O-methyltransferase YrrM
LRTALERGWRGDFAEAEKAEIARIEALRARVDASPEVIRTTGPEWSGDPDDGRVVELPLGELSRGASKRALSARVLFSLIREFKPLTCIELGSCVGISAAYQAAALELNGGGRLTSCEASAERMAAAERHVAELGLENVRFVHGRFQETLDPVLRGLDAPVDYAFIDGHHDEHATVDYFRQIAPYASESAIVVFDDIHWSAGMEQAWQRLEAEPALPLTVDVRDMGVAVT